MSNRKLAKAIQNLAREVQKLYRQFNRGAVNWLLRSAFVAHRRGQSPVAGFVLPAAILLILVLTLTVGAMTLRAFDRNVQVITNAQEKVIYNSATPAIDRARSKLEFLFDSSQDPRYPGGVPGEGFLTGMMINDGVTVQADGSVVGRYTIDGGADPYTLPDERRLDIGSRNSATRDGANDNAWQFRVDTDGKVGADGRADDATVIYSIIFKTPEATTTASAEEQLLTLSNQEKANLGVVRGGPLSSQANLTGCGTSAGSTKSPIEGGWFQDQGSTSVIRKNFQVNTIVIPDNPKAATVTMEFQQDRQILRGNKWGAWFRYNLEIFPGPQFNWNGAMHTEGSMLLGKPNDGFFEAYLVSSPASCLYQRESSELSITNQTGGSESLGTYNGQVAMGLVGKPAFRQGTSKIHVQLSDTTAPTIVEIKETNDNSRGSAAVGDIASDPVLIVLEEKTQSVSAASRTNALTNGWKDKVPYASSELTKRFVNKAEKVPFVDDLYRADDRWGPKPKYDSKAGGLIGGAVGTPIPPGNRLIETPAATGKQDKIIGLDGYWERRARTEGMRILVGERLELGNLGGWVTPRDVNRNDYIDPPATIDAANPPPLLDDSSKIIPAGGSIDTAPPATPSQWSELEGDPLYPPTVKPFPFKSGATLPHLTQQRRSLRDNIPAVQSAAVYHAAVGNKDYPVACMAMTVHPGTQYTLRQSTNFFPTSFKNNTNGGRQTADTYLLSDFFNGRGTNGWEYAPPGGSEALFTDQLAANQPLRIALDNLAHFAGDPLGAFPPTQGAVIRPYPALTMWGNYSNLRRALGRLDTVGYNGLSIADKTYIQTAACSLGMLATNVDKLQKFDPTNALNDTEWNNFSTKVLNTLAANLATLMDGRIENGEVLPKSRLATYGYSTTTNAPEPKLYNPADYYEVPPEAFIAGLKQQIIQSGADHLNSPQLRMAELIMTSHQVRRDRTFGFRPSPAFGEYAANLNTGVRVFPSACDPDLFALTGSSVPKPIGGVNDSQRNTSMADPGTDWTLKPFTGSYTTNTSFPGAVVGTFINVSGKRLALSRLCGAIRVPAGYTPGGTTITVSDPAKRPVVLPKFPSLYYIFPEVTHGLTGAFVSTNPLDSNPPNPAAPESTDGIANLPDEWDHRQPGAIGPNRTVSTAVNGPNDNAADASGINRYDREPYVTDTEVATAIGGYQFRPVSTALPTNPRLLAYPTPVAAAGPTPGTINPVDIQGTPPNEFFSRLPYANTSPFPIPDFPVSDIALAPRQIAGFPTDAQVGALPQEAPRGDANDTSPNRIMVPENPAAVGLTVNQLSKLPTKQWAVPFLDRAMFDGRQLQVARVTDIDWGMLRRTTPPGQIADNTEFSSTGREPWLPMSGIVYGFREDAVREDGIARPIGSSPVNSPGVTNETLILGTAMNVSNPTQPFDPALQKNGISIKAIDHTPDPYRRVHGFRMRNGKQLKRNPSTVAGIEASKNVRGLSFFTDQPVYMLGDFNLHQEGTGDEPGVGALLEEFDEQLFAGTNPALYTFDQFYKDRITKNTKFAKTNDDRWRPAEILADAISILSNDFCDGSIADAFVEPVNSERSIPDFKANNGAAGGGKIDYPNDIPKSVYDQYGLYSPGCRRGGKGSTSYQNQNRVMAEPPTDNQGWEWKREGAASIAVDNGGGKNDKPSWSDFTTPIQIGRTGEPLLIARPIDNNATLPINYGKGGFELEYATPQEGRGNGKRLISDTDEATRINAIVVSGLTPSRPNQSYGGLHNFPRFLENWDKKEFIFSGSFLQLNFSNYATAPFEQEGWDTGVAPTPQEPIQHYYPPNRLWGYDVGLQFAPAGPAAARFVAPSSTRSEFYTEPPVSDPYINKLCEAAKAANPNLATISCVSQQ